MARDQQKQKKKKHPDTVKKHFGELSRIVEEAHQELIEKESRFRLCIYQEGEDIFIDIVTVDKSGKANQVFKHDVSHSELDDLIQQIKSGRGLILDADV
jgi:hypothetical protein